MFARKGIGRISLVVVGLSFSAQAWAGHLVCFKSDTYWSETTNDSGVAPGPGSVIGHSTLAYESEILLDEDRLEGAPAQYHFVPLGDPPVTVHKDNSNSSVRHVYRQELRLMSGDLDSEQSKQVTVGEFLCEELIRFVPMQRVEGG